MASVINNNKRMFNVSPNIILKIDNNNVGDMYVYNDDNKGFILNGLTASYLIDYFKIKNKPVLVHEIIDTLMGINNINNITH